MTSRVADIAACAGVSTGTVSNVLNRPGIVKPITVARVMAAILDLQFSPNDAARRLRTGRGRTVSIMVPDLTNPFFAELAQAASREASRWGITVTMSSSDDDPSKELTHLRLSEAHRIRGLIICPTSLVAHANLSRLRKNGVHIVTVNPANGNKDFSSISVDQRAGGRLVGTHFIKDGRQRLAFVGSVARDANTELRLRGIRDAMDGRSDVTLEVINTSHLTMGGGREVAALIAERSPRERPDALFAANDLAAIGLIDAVVSAESMRVPNDLAVVGWDDIQFARSAPVPLSSINQSTAELGRIAMATLMEEMIDPLMAPRGIVIEPYLVLRGSSGVSPSTRALT